MADPTTTDPSKETLEKVKAVSVSRPRVAVSIPSGNGMRVNGIALAQLPGCAEVMMIEVVGAAWSWNQSWCTAIAAWEHGMVDYFLILHEDLKIRTDNWFPILFHEMQRVDADIISAVVPIKDDRGVTSTARESGDPFSPHRYTMADIFREPVTFSHPELLLNTGLMLMDLRRPWVKEFVDRNYHWACEFGIKRREDRGFMVQFMSEDWRFSRQARECGATRQYATRAIALDHVGSWYYPNDRVWGRWDKDKGDVAAGRGD